jgi:hypothetical protein
MPSSSWLSSLNADPIPWLLGDPNPDIPYLTLRYLLDRPADDPELTSARQAAFENGTIGLILSKMFPEGYWVKPGAGYTQRYRSTIWALIALAQLGASVEFDERLQTACQYELEHALAEGGQFGYNGTASGTIDCLQGNLCWALYTLGCRDARLDKAYEWMARSVTGEGVASNTDASAEIHYFNYKCGPLFACGANGKNSCAWGAVKVMLAFSVLPAGKHTPLIDNAIKQGVDFLFSVDPSTANYPTRHGQKPGKEWWQFGFPVFYVTDILQLAEGLAGLGYGKDPRFANTFDLIRSKQDDTGSWKLEHAYGPKAWGNYGELDQPNPWVTVRALRVLKTAYSG